MDKAVDTSGSALLHFQFLQSFKERVSNPNNRGMPSWPTELDEQARAATRDPFSISLLLLMHSMSPMYLMRGVAVQLALCWFESMAFGRGHVATPAAQVAALLEEVRQAQLVARPRLQRSSTDWTPRPLKRSNTASHGLSSLGELSNFELLRNMCILDPRWPSKHR